ncbi:MAG: dephospho-CoA kinase [Ruminococcus sp.]|nr:dephospho-CoA kinase [Ruminococcus sp.]
MSDKKYRLIGLTGPTGAGKSSASKIFEDHGFAIVDADKIAHKALTDQNSIVSLAEEFGESILNADGSINRKALAKCAFANAESTEKLNQITHPVITELSFKEFERLSQEGFENIIFDAPTLFEAGMDTLCDCVVSVIAPVKIRTERIKQRDNLTDEQAKARISAQKDDIYYANRSRFVIVNDTDADTLTKRTEEIIKEIL